MIQNTELISGDSVRIERILAAGRERIWEHLVDPVKRSRWFCAGDTLRDVGQRFAFGFNHTRITPEQRPGSPTRDPNEPDFVSHGEVLEFEPPRLLKFMWEQKPGKPSEVMFELTPHGDGTLIVITHTKLPGREDVVNVGGGWNAHLDILADELAARQHGPFWTNLAAYAEVMEKRVPK